MGQKLLCIAHAPDQKLQFELLHDEKDGLAFRILRDGVLVLSSSRLGIRFEGTPSEDPAVLLEHRVRPYPFGGTELLVRLRKSDRELVVRILVTDDRAAFRYEFVPGSKGLKPFTEKTSFRLALDASIVSETPESGLLNDRNLSLPVLFELDNGLYMSLDRVPADPFPLSLRLTEGRLLSVSGDREESLLPGNDEVTSWWTVSFTHP